MVCVCFQCIVPKECRKVSLGLCVLSNNISASVTVSPTHWWHRDVNLASLVACYLAHTFSTTTHSPSGFQAPPLPLSFYLSTSRGLWQRVQFSSSGGSPFVFVKSSFTGDLIPCALLFTAGKAGWTTLSGPPGSGQFKLKLTDTISSSVGQEKSLSKRKALSQAGGHRPHVTRS